jgi:hypothetical protein
VRTTAAHPGAGFAADGRGDLVPLTLALRLGGADAAWTAVTLDRLGAVLCEGRAKRLATPAQRRALAVRDGGCSFPGCDRPPAWCQAHHVIEWLDLGPTDIDNLTLACGFHHRHFAELGWQVVMNHGVPDWIPPPWLDPAQTPRRNTAHHRPDPLAGIDLDPIRAEIAEIAARAELEALADAELEALADAELEALADAQLADLDDGWAGDLPDGGLGDGDDSRAWDLADAERADADDGRAGDLADAETADAELVDAGDQQTRPDGGEGGFREQWSGGQAGDGPTSVTVVAPAGTASPIGVP